MEQVKKIQQFITGSSLKSVFRWSKCVHGRIVLVCVLQSIVTICGLMQTLATRQIIDQAVAGNENALWLWGACLGALVLGMRGLNYALGITCTYASTTLQRSMQEMIVREILSRDYSGLRKYHSGEMVNRFFSDAGAVRGGVLNLLPDLMSTAISFFGAAAIQSTPQPQTVDDYWYGMFARDDYDARENDNDRYWQDWRNQWNYEETRINWRSVIIWGLVIYFLFFRRKRRRRG